MNVFVYVRPWNKEQFAYMARRLFPQAGIYFVSDFRSLDEVGLAESFYESYKTLQEGIVELDSDMVDDVIRRCRLLRQLHDIEARKLVYAMGAAVEKVLDKFQPAYIFSLTVDSYVTDLLCRLGRLRGIPFGGMVPNMVNGYFRLCDRGEYNHLRDPSEGEVCQVLEDLLRIDYMPDFLKKQKQNLNVQVGIRWVKNYARYVFFSAKRRLSADPLNYHYWVSALISKQSCILCPPFNIGCKDWSRMVDDSEGRVFYFPLQYFPEATIDYWCEKDEMLRYQDVALELVRQLSAYGVVCVKEHPAMLGMRSKGFYSDLKAITNVLIVPTTELSSRLISRAHAVIVWTGSAGFEAALRGTPVISVCSPYYAAGRFVRTSVELDDLPDAVAWSDDMNGQAITRDEQKSLVYRMLSSCLLGSFINDGSWRPDNVVHRDMADVIVNSLREYKDAVCLYSPEGGGAKGNLDIVSVGASVPSAPEGDQSIT